MNLKNMQAIHVSDWIDIKEASEKYKINIDDLSHAIEERDIRTRGKPFNDDDGYHEKFIEIPCDIWRQHLFEHSLYNVCPSQANPIGERYWTFLYAFAAGSEWISNPDLGAEKRYGYIDIQINEPDFLQKITTKILSKEKRNHKHVEQIRRIYDAYKKRKNIEKVSPAEFLEYVIGKYSDKSLDGHDFYIEEIEDDTEDSRRSKLHIRIAEWDKSRSMTFGRFYNKISEFNKS